MRFTPLKKEDRDEFFSSPMHHALCSVAGCSKPAYRTAWPWSTKEVLVNEKGLHIQIQLSLCKEHWEYCWEEKVNDRSEQGVPA